MKIRNKIIIGFFIILLLAIFAAIIYVNWWGKTREYTAESYAMDTHMTLTIYATGPSGKDTLQTCMNIIEKYDALWSYTGERSDIARLNREHSTSVDYNTYKVLEYAKEMFEKTGGAFDPSTYPLTELWGFTSTPALPDAESVRQTLECCGFDRVRLCEKIDEDTGHNQYMVYLDENMKLGLGAIAKGYVTDEISKILRKVSVGTSGVSSAIISLGGNVYAYGTKPDGSQWKIGVKNPYNDENEYLCILSVSDKAIVTSAGYERNFTDEAGNVWHHIIDPKTGYSADSGLISVTIVSPDATLADATSTALYVMGLDEAVNYWHTYGEDFEMILATADQVYITPGLQTSIYGVYNYEIIE